MYAKGHEIVHAIVRFGHAVEDTCHALSLLPLRQAILESKMCRSVGRVGGVVGSGGFLGNARCAEGLGIARGGT